MFANDLSRPFYIFTKINELNFSIEALLKYFEIRDGRDKMCSHLKGGRTKGLYSKTKGGRTKGLHSKTKSGRTKGSHLRGGQTEGSHSKTNGEWIEGLHLKTKGGWTEGSHSEIGRTEGSHSRDGQTSNVRILRMDKPATFAFYRWTRQKELAPQRL